jgi:hypothetical protein
LLFCNLLLMSFLSLSSFFWRVFSVSFKFLSGTWSYRCWSYVIIPISFSWRCLISWLLVTYIALLLLLFLLTSLAVRKFCTIIVHVLHDLLLMSPFYITNNLNCIINPQ